MPHASFPSTGPSVGLALPDMAEGDAAEEKEEMASRGDGEENEGQQTSAPGSSPGWTADCAEQRLS